MLPSDHVVGIMLSFLSCKTKFKLCSDFAWFKLPFQGPSLFFKLLIAVSIYNFDHYSVFIPKLVFDSHIFVLLLRSRWLNTFSKCSFHLCSRSFSDLIIVLGLSLNGIYAFLFCLLSFFVIR